MDKKIKYFAYGSNLLQVRMHVNNPSAKRITIGKLKNYRLDFNHFSKRWKGNVATIVPDNKDLVWGVIWELPFSQIENLDRQEGVNEGIYKVISVDVEDNQGEYVTCRSYQLCDLPSYSLELPSSRYPSRIYRQTIIEGAIECKLPSDYIEKLKKLPHNDFDGPVQLECN